MKKILSIVLAILMLASMLTVLSSLGAVAETYVATASKGGTATVSGNTFIASAYYGNSFSGWYSGEEKVSSSANFTTNEYSALEARFVQNNQFDDGNFESGIGRDFLQQYNSGGSKITLTNASGKDGNGMNLVVTSNSLMNVRVPVSVKKDTNYVLSYDFKVNSYAGTSETATPVYAHMVSGSPSGDGTWGHWPALASWKITIRNSEDYSKSYTVTGTGAPEQSQIKFATIEENCGSGWLEFILEFNTGSDTSYKDDGNIFESSNVGTFFMSLGFNYAVANIDYDNFSFYEDNYAPVFNSKENVSVSRVGIGTVAAGTSYSFKINKASDIEATVTYNSKIITPVNDVYTLSLTADKNVYITASDDNLYPEMGKDMSGNNLTKYGHELYNKPVWEGDTVYHETAVFYKGRNELQLIYPIDQIVSVRSFDLQYYYVKGVDYDVVDGKLVILDGSSIPVYPHNPLSADGNGSWDSDFDGYDITGYSGGSVYPCTLSVTYKHTKTWADLGQTGYTETKQESVAKELTVFEKLCNGEDVHILFYGDSMTSGWSISGGLTYVYTAANDGTKTDSGMYRAPYAPSWMVMFIEGLRKEYPTANITYENISLGGKASAWGLQNFEARFNLLSNKDVDLFLLGWGINDCGGSVAPSKYKENEQAIIDALRVKCPDASVLMYSGNCTNTDAAMYNEETMRGYENAIFELADENDNAAATVLTSLFFDVMNAKESSDIFENNLNHTNDFGCRLYSQVMLSAMTAEHSYDREVFDADYTEEQKKLNGYNEEMGDAYKKVVSSTDMAFSEPINVIAGEKYLVHFKLLVIDSFAEAPLTDSKLTIAVSGADASILLSSKGGKETANGSYINAAWFANSNKELYGDGFVDVYVIIDAAESGTAYLQIGQEKGGVFGVCDFVCENVNTFAPAMVGATFNPTTDKNATTAMYVTNVDLPYYLTINSVSTYMGITADLEGTAYEHTFTDANDNVTAATLKAYKSIGYITKAGVTEAFRSGDLYSSFTGADTALQTKKYSVRTVIGISDAYGNDLSITLSTNNNADGIENGVYSRSLNQVKRLLAKNLINSKPAFKTLAEKTINYADKNKLYNGPIDEVWDFIIACSEYKENIDNPGTFPETGEEGEDFID